MRFIGTILSLLIIIFTSTSGIAETSSIGNGIYNDDLITDYTSKELEKSIVKIEVPSPDGGPNCRISTGSGFFLDKVYRLETAAHVLTFCSRSQINLEKSTIDKIIISNSYFKEPLVLENVKITKFDTQTDQATLDVTPAAYLFPYQLRPLKKAQHAPRAGEQLLVVGYPNKAYKVIKSLFSAIINIRGDVFFLVNTDVQGGASGGPTLNSDFEVIGVNAGIYVPDVSVKNTSTGKALISIL